MSIATARREKNINAELDDMRNKANSVLSQMNSVIERAKIYTAYSHTALVNNEPEIDQSECDRYTTSIAGMVAVVNSFLPVFDEMINIGASSENLAAFIAKYNLNVDGYSNGFN